MFSTLKPFIENKYLQTEDRVIVNTKEGGSTAIIIDYIDENIIIGHPPYREDGDQNSEQQHNDMIRQFHSIEGSILWTAFDRTSITALTKIKKE